MSKELAHEIAQLHAEVCQALGHPKRILILYKLSQGKKSVSELAEALGMSQATASRHLKVLRDRAMVTTEREGVNIYYSLADRRIIQALDLLRKVLASILERRKELAEAISE
jgi:ArsR family transcriptional regulator